MVGIWGWSDVGRMATPLSRTEAKLFLETRFAEHYARFFDGALAPIGFCFFDRYHDAITKEEKYAAFIGGPEYGAKLLMFTDDALRQRAEFLSDSVLHEMIHYAQKYLDKDTAAERHGAAFVRIANRIADALGLGHVEPESDGANCWPQSLRR